MLGITKVKARTSGEGPPALVWPQGLFKDLILHTLFSQDHISDQGTMTFGCTALCRDYTQLAEARPHSTVQTTEMALGVCHRLRHSKEGAGLGPSSSRPLADSFYLVGP